jgi:hypothetical protein
MDILTGEPTILRGIFRNEVQVCAVAEGEPPPGVAWEVDSVRVEFMGSRRFSMLRNRINRGFSGVLKGKWIMAYAR